jgi:hypothetical protein
MIVEKSICRESQIRKMADLAMDKYASLDGLALFRAVGLEVGLPSEKVANIMKTNELFLKLTA